MTNDQVGCPDCGQWPVSMASHRCPPTVTPPATQSPDAKATPAQVEAARQEWLRGVVTVTRETLGDLWQAIADAVVAADVRTPRAVERPQFRTWREAFYEATERALAAEAESKRLTHLLGSHADGHRCTCTMTDPGVYHGDNMHPPEWEQNPWCPTHPDVNYIAQQYDALRAKVARVEAIVDDPDFANGHVSVVRIRAAVGAPRVLVDSDDDGWSEPEADALRARVKALADDWECEHGKYPGDSIGFDYAARLVRRALSEPAPAPEAEPTHIGGNAEDCPACEADPKPLAYPFLCPATPTPEATVDFDTEDEGMESVEFVPYVEPEAASEAGEPVDLLKALQRSIDRARDARRADELDPPAPATPE